MKTPAQQPHAPRPKVSPQRNVVSVGYENKGFCHPKSDWSKIALKFLQRYAKTHRTFSGEMVRNASEDKVPVPPSLRAWGAIMLKGMKRGWIRQVGYTKVLNPKAHKANATIWESCIMKGEQHEGRR